MTRRLPSFAAALLAAALPGAAAAQPPPPAHAAAVARAAAQARGGSEQTETETRVFRIGPRGAFELSNLAGNVTIVGTSGDEIRLEAVKRVRAGGADEARRQLASVRIETFQSAGRVEVKTNLDPGVRKVRVEVDYTVQVPRELAVSVRSLAGDQRVKGVRGDVRLEAVSGNIDASATPRLLRVKTMSGDITITEAAAPDAISAETVSGSLHVRGLKARMLDSTSVSGDLILEDAVCERAMIRTINGNVAFSGTLARGGRYEINSHSGDVELTLADGPGFELSARTFAGDVRSALPLTGAHEPHGQGGLPHVRELRGTFGDGSAFVLIKTFSGDVVVQPLDEKAKRTRQKRRD